MRTRSRGFAPKQKAIYKPSPQQQAMEQLVTMSAVWGSPAHLCVLFIMAQRTNRHLKFCWMGRERIAERLACPKPDKNGTLKPVSARYVQRLLDELEAQRLVERLGGGFVKQNGKTIWVRQRYRLTLDADHLPFDKVNQSSLLKDQQSEQEFTQKRAKRASKVNQSSPTAGYKVNSQDIQSEQEFQFRVNSGSPDLIDRSVQERSIATAQPRLPQPSGLQPRTKTRNPLYDDVERLAWELARDETLRLRLNGGAPFGGDFEFIKALEDLVHERGVVDGDADSARRNLAKAACVNAGASVFWKASEDGQATMAKQRPRPRDRRHAAVPRRAQR